MTRLLQVIAGAQHGGAEAFFTRLALALQRDGQQQSVAIRRDPVRAATLRAGGVDVAELPFGGWFDFTTKPALRRLAEAYPPDVILSWMSRAASMTPVGFGVHVARLGGYYDLKYYRRCDHLIGNTPDIVRYLVEQGWPTARAHYLPNFVDDLALPATSRATLQTPDAAPLVLALGRLHKNKGFDVLLEALARVPDIWLWLGGEGPERAALEAQAARLGIAGRVRFLGWREDGAALMAAADLFVCPSRHEPLGNVVIEAWARSVPVIAAASQGPRQLIRPDIEGCLVPIDDSAALADAMRDLASSPARRQSLAEAGRSAYEAGYAEAAVVSQYRAFFERVAA